LAQNGDPFDDSLQCYFDHGHGFLCPACIRQFI